MLRKLVPLIAIAAAAAASSVAAATFPERPIRLMVPFAPGGATDVIARSVATSMSRSMGQQVVVENKPGAGGVVAGQQVAKSGADGYTLLMGSIGMLSISPNLRNDLPYVVERSFAPVALVSATPNVIVAHPSFKPGTVRELIEAAKASPGKIAFASSGQATSTHLSGELFQAMTGTSLVHVPYRGGAPALNDLLAGQITLMFDTMASVPSVRSGKLKAIAITGDKRSPLLPEVPTVAEAGLPGYRTVSWNGILAPAGTPKDVIAKLNAEINKALASPEVQKSLATDGSEPRGGSPEEFGRFIAEETQRWGKLIKDAGITAAP